MNKSLIAITLIVASSLLHGLTNETVPDLQIAYVSFGNISKQSDSTDGIFSHLFSFYDEYISPIDGDRCPMQPSCSHYGRQAIETYGFVIGLLMTFDRLQRCGYDKDQYNEVRKSNRVYLHDPVVKLRKSHDIY